MPITWRTELHFSCDCGLETYVPNCESDLMLDQLDAKTKKGMFALAKKLGWVRVGDKCYCPYCAKNGAILPIDNP